MANEYIQNEVKKVITNSAFEFPLNHAMAAVWIMANFKETQLKDMRVGQKARIEVDAFSSQTFFGTVASISPVSGAELALLPPDNATGNFTKVVQRIPVKIIFDPQKAPKMIPGMSVHIDINTKKSA